MGKLSPIFQSEGQEAQSLLDVLQVMRPESDGAGPQPAAVTTSQGAAASSRGPTLTTARRAAQLQQAARTRFGILCNETHL